MRFRNRGIGVFELMFSICAAGVVLVEADAVAQHITDFGNGYLTFTNANPSFYYRVEFKPNLTGDEDWDGSYSRLRNIQTNAPEVTVPVGVFYRVVGSDEPVGIGTARAGDILAPKTVYVNEEEVTGTMPDWGGLNVTPNTTAQPIQEGFHNGTGFVAGDVDLVTGNIKKDVVIFGVTGTYEGSGGGTYNAAVPKTGQTTSYLTGDDGDLEKGVAWPSPRFTGHGDGTVTDNLTGLLWMKAPHLLSGNGVAQTWNNAMAFCNGLQFAGHADWRLPNVRELQSLIDYGRSNPALPEGHSFTGLHDSDDYWSSSTSALHPDFAWFVYLPDGLIGHTHKTSSFYVWPVRAGQ